jgi:hypothetical protein
MNTPVCPVRGRTRRGDFIRNAGGILLLAWIAAGCASEKARPDSNALAEAKAVSFLSREVPAWSRENHCYSCHNNGDAARALYAATRKGHRIPSGALADTTAWVAQPGKWDENKGDPGFSDKRLANLQFAASLLAAIEAGHVTDRRALRAAALKVAADQAADGSWPIDSGNAVGSPATYGTMLATFMALTVLKAVAAPETQEATQKAEAWLRQLKSSNVLASSVSLLAPTRDQATHLELIRRAQTSDGGWGPYVDSPPEVFDTALVLLALAEKNQLPGVSEMIRRGRGFLLTQQQSDGGWPATTRPSGGHSYAQRVSTTGWATMALLATRKE